MIIIVKIELALIFIVKIMECNDELTSAYYDSS
jgi:hypothetical protein